jgi:hypothetical protein
MASKDRDLINDPVDLAAQRAIDQEADITSRFLPTEHLRPVTRFLHEQGITRKVNHLNTVSTRQISPAMRPASNLLSVRSVRKACYQESLGQQTSTLNCLAPPLARKCLPPSVRTCLGSKLGS